jgi:putative endopeptidase
MPGPGLPHVFKYKIKIPPLFEKMSPGTDFYWYVNGTWQKRTNIPNYLSSFGVSEEIETQVDEQLYKIMNNSSKTAINVLTQSALNASAQYNNIKTLKSMISEFQCIHNTNDVARILGDFCLYRMNCLFTIYNIEQEEDHHKNRIYLGAGKLGLPDKSYYSGKANTLTAYAHLLEKLGKLLEIPYNLIHYVQLEASLAENIDKADFDKDVRLDRDDLIARYPSIPFNDFLSTLNINKNIPIIISSHKWLKTVEKLFKTWSLDNWRIFFTGSLILHSLVILPPPYNDLYFEFFGKRMKDQPDKISQKRLALTMIKEWLPITLSKEYVKLYVSPQKKEEGIHFVKELVKAAKERMNNTLWLSPETRERSKKKLDAMNIGVAYPDIWPETKAIDLNPDNMLENILNLGKLMTLEDLEKEGERSKRSHMWDDPVFAVNAYYYSQGNGIIIPAGILNWPFFKLDAPLGWNYGALGCAIGHEMTHAFDMDGKNYDERGYMEPWWTVGDNRAYNKKTKELVKIYSESNYMDHKVNGGLTLSENIADLGGVGISLGALEEKLVGVDLAERKKALRNFFIAYAVSWRTKERKQKAYQSLIIDKHAPPTLRVNLIVSQFDQWYEAFDIGENSILFREPEARVRIF